MTNFSFDVLILRAKHIRVDKLGCRPEVEEHNPKVSCNATPLGIRMMPNDFDTVIFLGNLTRPLHLHIESAQFVLTQNKYAS